MINPKEIAENATIQSILNCYLRETGNYFDEPSNNFPFDHLSDLKEVISIPLSIQQIELIVPVKYWSITERHLFHFPIYFRREDQEDLYTMDYVTCISLLVKELLLNQNRIGSEDELILRVILSCQSMKNYIEKRAEDCDSLLEENFEYIEAEQSLLFGHLLHPTPKSKQGLSERDDRNYSPEMKGEFQLHYFEAHQSIVLQDSSKSTKAADIIIRELKSNDAIDKKWLKQIEEDTERVLIPVHPLQVNYLLEKPKVKKLLTEGTLNYIGPLGRKFTATSSFRTVYSKEARYMYKFSVPVKITNSLRVNKVKELDRGVEISKLMGTEVGGKLSEQFPDFKIIEDPAYINLDFQGEESGFEVVIRENPFYENSKNTSLIAALCQDHAYGGNPRIASIINSISKREGRPADEVSLAWFEKYLAVTLEPMLWLFDTYGIALEAHQQNSVIQLKDGYPETFYYRDNQGYYFSESQARKLVKLLPDLNKKSDTICSDEVAEERFRYYFFINHLFGLINGFGVSGLIDEERLIQLVKERIQRHIKQSVKSMNLLNSLLYEPVLPCKANLLTRFYDMDELVGSLESQSVYTLISNPLASEVEIEYAT